MSDEGLHSSATLMILGDSLEPSVVTKLLGLRPSQQWRRGEQKQLVRNNSATVTLESVHQWGGWKRWSTARERKKKFAVLVNHWCQKLSPKKKALSQLRTSGCEVYLDCCLVGDGGEFSLSPSLLERLASIGVIFRVSFYSTDESAACSLERNS